MPSDTKWYLSLDRQHLHKAYAANGPLKPIDFDVDFLLQCAPAAVDVVTGVTDQSVCVYLNLLHGSECPGLDFASVIPRSHQESSNHYSSPCFLSARSTGGMNQPIIATKSSPIRCHISELRDCITWLVFQTLEDIASIPIGHQFDKDFRPPGEDCHREVEYALRTCRTNLVQYLLKALYFAAVAVRLLDPEELFDVVQDALAEPRQFQIKSDEDAPRSSTELLRLVARLLTVNTAGKVQFRSDSMRTFLLLSQYLAQENGDEYMARTCLEYLFEESDPHVLKPWCGYRNNSRFASRRPFFRYASSHWHRHYRSAENESNDLAAQLHQRIEHEVNTLWNHQGFLRIELRELCLQMGLAVCTYYGFQLLVGIYQQMGASDCNMTSVLLPFPRPHDYSLPFARAEDTRLATAGTEMNYRMMRKACEAAPVHAAVESNWVESLTDGESSLEESWASLPSRPPSEQWISDFDDLRLGFDKHVFVHQHDRKGLQDDWELIDRKPGLGFGKVESGRIVFSK